MPQRIDYAIDPLLTEISKSYSNKNFIADIIFPRVTVNDIYGSYYVYDKSGFRIEKDLRTGKARANRVDYGMSLATYGPLLEHSLEQGIEDDEKKFMGEEKARENATRNVTSKVMLNHEKMVADKISDTAVVTQNETLSGTSQFSDYNNSDPLAKIATALDTIDATAINAGARKVIFMGYQVWSVLRNHPDLRDMLGIANNRTPITPAQAATFFEVDEIVIGNAKYDSAKEGQTSSLSYVWGKNLWVAALASPSGANGQFELSQVNPGYTLQLGDARYVDRWDEREVKTEFVRFNDYFEPKLVAAEALFLYKNAVA